MRSNYISGSNRIGERTIRQVSSRLNTIDYLGAVMVRWGINRNNFRIAPGLYYVGNPDASSDVFVTANYKLSFDHLRKNLAGIDGWILILDTKGVNVWCAAGKGTFSTDELINRLRLDSIENLVNHRRLILPQLGATGVAAHKVKEATGFNVHYGPVRASDIRKYIGNKYRADREMRKVRFGLTDRIKLIPNDFMYGKYYLLWAFVILYMISGITPEGISFRDFPGTGGPALLNVFLAYTGGIVVTPLLLPYIPGRYFSLKGFFTGTVIFLLCLITSLSEKNLLIILSWFFLFGAFSSFTAMNFTGSSTYTSLSGVKKEMKLFMPVQISFALAGIILQIIGKVI